MTCHQSWKELLNAYFDDELLSEQKDTVNNHLVDCPACQKYLKQLQTLSSRIKDLKNEPLSLDLEQRLNHLNRTRTQEPAMQKTTFKNVMKFAVPMIVAGVFIFSFQMYAQRSIQGRLRDAAKYLPPAPASQQIVLENTRPQRQNIPQYDTRKYELDNNSDKTIRRLMNGTTSVSISSNFDRDLSWKETATVLRPEEITVTHRNQAIAQKALENEYWNGSAISDKQTSKKDMKVSAQETARARTPAQIDNNYQYEAYYQDTDYSIDRSSSDERQFQAPYTKSMPSIFKGGLSGNVNAERYDLINENEFLNVSDNPLSTFSIDVDTASYSNVRRFLNSNQMPPRDAVRIEELINYFQYNYPQPGWNQPFSITLEHGVCPWNQSHQLVLVGLQGKELTERQTPLSNLVFLIDVSGSMNEPAKLPLLKESLKMMVAQLRPDERVSMVVYAGAAGVVLDSTPGYNKGLIMSAIDNLQAGGSTAGGQGIQLAYNIAQKNFIHNGNNRVILATDGDFNVGVSSDSELVQIIEEKRKSGIFLTVLGFGSGNLQDAKMEKLADKGNGNYFYIDSLNEGKKVLVDELGSTLIAIAKDVKIQIEFNPKAVKSYRLIGYENRKLAKEDFNDDTKDAGELGAGHTVTALYEIIPAGSWESTGGNVDPLKYQKQTVQKPLWGSDKEMMTVKLRYKEPKSETSQLITKVLYRPAETFGQRWFGSSENLQFASAVAEFGMLLRDSNFKAASSYQNVLQRAQNCSYNDPRGYKNEFISLVQKAAALDTRPTPVPVYQPQYQNYPMPVDEQGAYNQKSQ